MYAKRNKLNLFYPNQNIDTEIPHGLQNHVTEPDTVEITFDLDIESTDKIHSIVFNANRA